MGNARSKQEITPDKGGESTSLLLTPIKHPERSLVFQMLNLSAFKNVGRPKGFTLMNVKGNSLRAEKTVGKPDYAIIALPLLVLGGSLFLFEKSFAIHAQRKVGPIYAYMANPTNDLSHRKKAIYLAMLKLNPKRKAPLKSGIYGVDPSFN